MSLSSLGFVALLAVPAAAALPPPPMTRTCDHVDTYHGVPVADPYRWLEDTGTREVRAWIEAQQRRTGRWLDGIPERDDIRRRLTALWSHERRSVPRQAGGRLFFTRNEGLLEQSLLMVQDGEDAQPRVLLDPNTLSADGSVALASWVPSPDGSLLAYAISDGGSDWREWRVREVATGHDRPDVVKWSKFSDASWTKDGRGFFYVRFRETEEQDELTSENRSPRVFRHALGTSQDADDLWYERPGEPEIAFSADVTDDGRWLVISVFREGSSNDEIHLRDLERPAKPVRPLATGFDAQYSVAGNVGSRFFLRTDAGAGRWRVIAVDAENPSAREEIVPEAEHALAEAELVGGRLVLRYLVDACARVVVRDLAGAAQEVALPGLGTVEGIRSGAEPVTYYSYASWTQPASIFRLDVRTGQARQWWAPETDFDTSRYVTRQVFIESADGTRVPMFLVHREGLEPDGARPTWLYGYGGFNISITPKFSPANLLWMEMGGLLAVANLRGGGEYGEAWHEAGTKLVKQNVFDDFIAAAEWLVANKWTQPSKLAIGGRSNGGLLVGAVLVQRPELFGAAVPAVGVLDMLRYHRFTIGWAWISDYGCSDDPEEFRALLAYSPVHAVRPRTKFPATLVMTADHDDRVVPCHSYKFAAALQAAQAGDEPVLLRVGTRAGHGALTSTSRVIAEDTDRLAFLVRALDMRPRLRGETVKPPAR